MVFNNIKTLEKSRVNFKVEQVTGLNIIIQLLFIFKGFSVFIILCGLIFGLVLVCLMYLMHLYNLVELGEYRSTLSRLYHYVLIFLR